MKKTLLFYLLAAGLVGCQVPPATAPPAASSRRAAPKSDAGGPRFLDHHIADAIRRQEGTWTYGIKTLSVQNEAQARRICLNTIRNAWRDWQSAGRPTHFLDYLADRYCPPSADPLGNRHWKKNVKQFVQS